ncbi:MAG: EAL domain-containing protein [Oribacterium sp.]|nr:EAL domain-containing protein [Oribacterium sp.]
MVAAIVMAGALGWASYLRAQGSEEQLVVGVPTDRCPMFYRDDSGEIVGIGVDLMEAAAEEAGYRAVFVELEEPTLKAALDNTEYDVVMPFGSAINSSSDKASVATENLIRTPFTLVTKENRGLPPINGIKIGMLSSLGGGAETVRGLYPSIEIVFYETMDECVRALRRGEVDALLHNSYVWSYVLQKPSYSDLAVHPASMFSMDFRVGTMDTPKGWEIVERLNKGIAALDDTKREAIVLDYTTRRLYKYDFSDYLHIYGIFLLLGAVIIAALIVVVAKEQRELHRKHEEKVKELIERDPLTGVLSKEGFRKAVERLLKEHPEIPYMISYNNIMDFKYINDSLGKDAGDELLRFWAERSMRVLTDMEAMGRIESDHFVVLRKIGGSKRIEEDEKLVFDPVRNYFIDRGKDIRVQMSSGIYVIMPEDYQNPDVDHMLDFARVAEKKVHETKKDGYEFYNPAQWERGKWTADVVGHLRTAVKKNELLVWYQPQVDYGTGQISGAEALCRWNHTKLGCIPPSEFIPALENSGSIYELDCFVWERVCQDLQRWNRQGKHMAVSVNVSRCDLHENRDIAAHFCELLRKYELTADQLRIEITESAYVEDSGLLIDITRDLKKFGFQVEMDDFGSGYSSLNMLKEVPVDRIKLDLRFLTETGNPEKGRIIVECMIHMAKLLGMDIIAEGVETKEQAEFLKSLGCTEMQGYFFHKPMPVEKFEAL